MVFWTLIISLGAIAADVILKRASQTNNYWFVCIGVILYALDALLWFWVYKTAKFSTVGIVYSVFTIVLSVGIGVLYFKEQLGVRELIGIVLGLSSIYLLSRFS